MEENRSPKRLLYVNLDSRRPRRRQRIRWKYKRGRMEEYLVEKSDRKKYITERNSRSY
jgi:hypothetical protein